MPDSAVIPFAYAVDPEARLAYLQMWGRVTGADLRRAAAAVHDDPQWEDGFDVIWDCSRVTRHVVDVEDIQPLVDEEVNSGPGRNALVESPSLGDSAITKMLAAFCRRRGKDSTVHATLDEALAAVGHDTMPEALARVR